MGFENADFTTSQLEDSPQNMEINRVYDVIIQWDSKGYAYTILYSVIIVGILLLKYSKPQYIKVKTYPKFVILSF